MKNWVLILHRNGTIKAWRDYDQTWGSPDYTVLGYHQGTYREALRTAHSLADSTPTPPTP
jgi:hypothetical protein